MHGKYVNINSQIIFSSPFCLKIEFFLAIHFLSLSLSLFAKKKPSIPTHIQIAIFIPCLSNIIVRRAVRKHYVVCNTVRRANEPYAHCECMRFEKDETNGTGSTQLAKVGAILVTVRNIACAT